MSIHRFAVRRDGNEPALIKEARKLGWWMLEIRRPCDWLGHWRGVWYPVEIKLPKARYTPAQVKFMKEADWRNAPVLIWRSIDDIVSCSKAY
jgi:hypothetical protein